MIIISNRKLQYETIMYYLRSNSDLKRFKYYDSFLKKWKSLLRHHYENNCVFYQDDTTDFDQFYHYEHKLIDAVLEFDFSIKYIDYFFQKMRNDYNWFPKITLDYYNGALTYGESKCVYNLYDKNECKPDYANMEDIFIIPFPSNPLTHIVVDGNHRLSLLIHSGYERISARYCRMEICERALFSSFHIALYSCLFDCAFIQYNMNKISDQQIKRHLKIFSDDSFVNNIEGRKNCDI